MIEYLVIGLILATICWLAYRHSALERQVSDLKSALPQSCATNPDDLEKSVAQMIDELKAAADDACREVTQRIEELRNIQMEMTSKVPEERFGIGRRSVLPVALVTQLAEAGLSPIDIAKQTGIGQAEVELTLRFHHRGRRMTTALRPIKEVRQYQGKEIAVA